MMVKSHKARLIMEGVISVYILKKDPETKILTMSQVYTLAKMLAILTYQMSVILRGLFQYMTI